MNKKESKKLMLSAVKNVKKFTMKQPTFRPFGKNLVVLTEDFHYKDKVINITIPKNAKTDGASIPKFFWRMAGSPHLPEYRMASLVHDYLYKTGLYNKKIADQTFKKLLKAHYVSGFAISILYSGVKMGGGFPYRKWRRLQKKAGK